jgi:opacity protein-like surface antigen
MDLKIQEDHRRSEMKKFLTIVGLLTVLATPAFAQAYDPDNGTGNVIDEPALEQAGRADASSAYAQAPEKHTNHKTNVDRYSPANVDPYSPANTGGGSEGYNWNLENDY